ncbi:AAEL000453-PA [Aedes aegypti]|uniref:AAEL000453-PA n=1 Tax=Aedes aegypti TaxID=7159 RepID=Q17PC4_AEDAE|nr:AAEL000453-PA [Aedes aegypti]
MTSVEGSSKGENSKSAIPVIVNRGGMIGSIEPYVPGECFGEYKERLELFFELNDVIESKRVAMLITLIGPETYKILKSLVIPAEPKTKSFEELVTALTGHFAPTVNVIAERYKFHQCVQASSESIAEYIVAIKARAQSSSILQTTPFAVPSFFDCHSDDETTLPKNQCDQ